MRKILIAGNWKMNMTTIEAGDLVGILSESVADPYGSVLFFLKNVCRMRIEVYYFPIGGIFYVRKTKWS
jgi:hypothetical protein